MPPTDYDVIIIDDEVSVTDIFQQYIIWKYSDWRFMTFNNPTILFNAITEGQLQAKVWVIDIMMPIKNGADIAAAIRQKHGDQPTILAYTALERGILNTKDAYRENMKHFNHIINKREDFTSILSLLEVWINDE